jgi:glycosyltransferase involved in cell wall biosynthesis
MQEHTGSLTRRLDRHGVVQMVLTTRPPSAPWVERLTSRTTIVRVALPVRRPRQLYALPAALLAPLFGRRADVVHVHLGEDLAILPLGALAAAPRGLPVVLTVHCSLAHTLEVTDVRSAILRHIGGLIERAGERRADTTLVYTRRLAERIESGNGGATVQIMRRGVDAQVFAAPGPDPFPEVAGRPRVVFVGRITPQKGVETLVRALVLTRTRGARFLLVGDGPHRSRVEHLAAELGVADRLHVTGFVPHERVPALLATADMLVLPSHYEELGTVLIEAMHAGVPVVASRTGGIPEVVQDGVTGLLVAPDDPGVLAQAIDTVAGDPQLATRLGSNALRRAPYYDLNRVGVEVHALYQRLVAEWAVRHRQDGAPAHRGEASLWPA